MTANGSPVRSGKTWEPVSPDNVRNSCLVPVEVWIPILAAEAEQVGRTRRKTWSWARSRFLCPTAGVFLS